MSFELESGGNNLRGEPIAVEPDMLFAPLFPARWVLSATVEVDHHQPAIRLQGAPDVAHGFDGIAEVMESIENEG